MSDRRPGTIALFGALLMVASQFAVAQTADPPRTPWGAPDLGGVWDYRSATPLARPPEFKDKPVLTEEEAAALARQRAEWIESLDSGEGGGEGHAIHTRVFLADHRPADRPPSVPGAAERRAAVAGSFGPGPFAPGRI